MADEAAAPARIGNRLLAALPEGARAAILAHAQRYRIEAGEIVYDVGDRFTHSVFVETGVVSETTVLADGRMAESGTIGNESKIGATSVLMRQVANRAYVVRVAGTALFVPLVRLDAAVRADFEARNVYMKLSQAMQDATLQIAACNTAHTIEQRAARWLLQAHDRIEGDALFLKQSTLAEALGARRATISEICSAFADAGAIGYARGHMRIRDRAGLEHLSCECHGVIKRGFDEALGAPPPAAS
ncbi:Crp/Fnr family transcriptional regulator [Salinarimonas chemoclinalis]|uniref:Crp/Fnr family transcriptional regulator n=1 Tax=Salinarimonas chemoclinalis TaxID=3241599 RepID=UPI003555D17C